jgi:hypothetical protein
MVDSYKIYTHIFVYAWPSRESEQKKQAEKEGGDGSDTHKKKIESTLK